MAEEKSVTETTVQKGSQGSVKVPLDEYNELVRKANEEKTVYNPVYKTVEKTPEMVANDHVVAGNIFLMAGVAQVAIGAWLRFKGKKELAQLAS